MSAPEVLVFETPLAERRSVEVKVRITAKELAGLDKLRTFEGHRIIRSAYMRWLLISAYQRTVF